MTLTVTDNVGVTATATGSINVNAHVGGLWLGMGQASVRSVETDVQGIVAEDGRAYFALGSLMLWGNVAAFGDLISGHITGTPIGLPPLDSFTGFNLRSLDGSIEERTSIDANACSQDPYPGYCLDFPQYYGPLLALAYQSSYDDDSSLTLVAGTYLEARGQPDGVLNIAENGDLFLQDPASGCVINGHVAIIDPDYNAYGLELSYDNCTDPVLNGATFSGLATYNGQAKELTALVQGTLAGGAIAANSYLFVRQ